jgi:hypothetical protein
MSLLTKTKGTAMDEQAQQLSESNHASHQCRLCGGSLTEKFSSVILNKYQITYYLCGNCNSLQTEYPYWLDEAYSEKNYNTDTGALQRNINNFASCYALSKLLSVNKFVDFGGKDGLLCRFLRDHLIDCYVYDKYSTPTYSLDFEASPNFKNVDLVMAFEVFEHFSNPKVDLDEIFSFQSNFVLVTTTFYSDQNADWWYLAKETGQHVFFYSTQAINLVAKRYGYGVTMVGGMILFYKTNIPDIHNKIVSCQTALKGWIFQAIKSYIFHLPAPGAQKDYEHVISKVVQQQL